MLDVLERDGLSVEILSALSYKSSLGINLKKNLHYFEKDLLMQEIIGLIKWYDSLDVLRDLALDYRIKSLSSAREKYERHSEKEQARKVFNDVLGFRSLCDNYRDVLTLKDIDGFRIADMTSGKSADDGYRGVHIYFQYSGYHYPIEIQYNTYYDRQFNNWLHKYIYKNGYDNSIGFNLRAKYESGSIMNENDFRKELQCAI